MFFVTKLEKIKNLKVTFFQNTIPTIKIDFFILLFFYIEYDLFLIKFIIVIDLDPVLNRPRLFDMT